MNALSELFGSSQENEIMVHNWMTKIINNPESISASDIEQMKPFAPAILKLTHKHLLTQIEGGLLETPNGKISETIEEEIKRIFSVRTKADDEKDKTGFFAEKVKSATATSPERS